MDAPKIITDDDMPDEISTVEELRASLRQYARQGGWQRQIDAEHLASYVRRGPTLLVSFESVADTLARPGGLPLGLDFVEDKGWSLLHVASEGETGFRSPAMFDFLDALSEDETLLAHERVVFYGAGLGGFAACAYSVVLPCAVIVAIAPRASLDPRRVPWESRHRSLLRRDVSGRYADAAALAEGARRVFILNDPHATEDAAHASIFSGDNVTRLACRYCGPQPEQVLFRMDILHALVEQAAQDMLTPLSFARLFRARQQNGTYLRNMLLELDRHDKPRMTARLCRHVLERQRAPAFRKRLRAANELLEARGMLPIEPRE